MKTYRVALLAALLSAPGVVRAEKKPFVPWGVQKLNAPAAWAKSKGAIAICLVGSGVDGKSAGVKVDGGYNVLTKDDKFMDDEGQGTSIASIVASVAPEASFFAVKVFGPESRPNKAAAEAIAGGILKCSKLGYKIINVVGIDEASVKTDVRKSLEKAVAIAYANGAVIVSPASAGLYSTETKVAFPARYAKVVAVASSDSKDGPLLDGNSGGFIDTAGARIGFIAPGDRILAKEIGGKSVQVTGGGAAAAYVTGLAALYAALHPNAPPAAVRQALEKAATPLKEVPPDQQGRGMIDAAKLVAL